MKPLLAWAALCGTFIVATAQAQPAWRCGNEYTTDAASAQRPGCRAVVPGRPRTQPRGSTDTAGAADPQMRDRETRAILEAELRSTLAQQSQLREEERGTGAASAAARPDTARGLEIKAQMARNESDLAALRREIRRLSEPR